MAVNEKVRSSKSSKKTGSEATCSYSDISRLSLPAINQRCREFGIDTTLPKGAKINAVCHCLSVSTTGTGNTQLPILPRTAESLSKAQLEYLLTLTPRRLYTITDWSSDISLLPAIEESCVKKYLLQTDVLDGSCERTYKLSRPYQLKNSVHSVQFSDLSGSSLFLVIRARCNPSQSTSNDEVKLLHIVIDRVTGEPYGGYCTCTAG